MKRTWRRRNYFIKKDLQGKYIFSFFIFVLLGSILFTVIFSYLTSDTMTIVYDNYTVRVGQTPFMLLKETLSAHWIFIVTGGLLVIIVSMFLTHRFAGPLFRFEKSVEEMISGNFDFQIRLRNKDEGKELAEKINRLITMISSSMNDLKRLNADMEDTLSDIAKTLEERDGGREAPGTVKKARELNRRMHEIMARFRVKQEE
ncbi:MAG: methyl-accepting chemotaxis protein [Nitrospirota bacterium]